MENKDLNENSIEVSNRQKQKWPYFEKKIRRSFINYPEGLEENLSLAKGYLEGDVHEIPHRGVIKPMNLGYDDRILMHPNATKEVIIDILDNFVVKGYAERLPYVNQGMELSAQCTELVQDGLVSKSVAQNFIDEVYGFNIEETISKNNLDFENDAPKMLNSYLRHVVSWILGANGLKSDCVVPVDRWLLLSKGLLLKVSDGHVEVSSYILDFFFELLASFEEWFDNNTEEIRLDSIDKNREIIADLRSELISSKDKYCLKLQDYISQLEHSLSNES